MDETKVSPTPTVTILTERFAQEQGVSAPRVDRVNNVIRGVKILGQISENRHPVSGKQFRYTDDALRSFAPLQEGARVYADHLDDDAPHGASRSIKDQLGEVRNVESRFGSHRAGNYADFYYNPHHPLTESILWAAENAPHTMGFSHVAEGAGQEGDNFHNIMEGRKVHSVDLVSQGATVDSLFEGIRPTKTKEPKENTMETEKLQEALSAEKTKVIELIEQRNALQAEVDQLKEDKAKADHEAKRLGEIRDAGVDPSSLKEGLLGAILSADDAGAAAIIDSLRESPQSAPASEPKNMGSLEDTLKSLEG